MYVTGSFSGTANFNTPSDPASNTLISAGSADIFVAKYDANGAVQWLKRAGGTTVDVGNGIAVDANGVYVTGYFSGTANFNTPSAPGSNELTSVGGVHYFLARFSNCQGVASTATGFGASGPLSANACSVPLLATAFGDRYIVTGPGGYVFSNVHRTVASRELAGISVTQPGTYTLKVYNGLCSTSYTTEVSGTACPKGQ